MHKDGDPTLAGCDPHLIQTIISLYPRKQFCKRCGRENTKLDKRGICPMCKMKKGRK